MGSVTVLRAGQQTKQHNNKDEREKIIYTPIKTKSMFTTTTTPTTHTQLMRLNSSRLTGTVNDLNQLWDEKGR